MAKSEHWDSAGALTRVRIAGFDLQSVYYTNLQRKTCELPCQMPSRWSLQKALGIDICLD